MVKQKLCVKTANDFAITALVFLLAYQPSRCSLGRRVLTWTSYHVAATIWLLWLHCVRSAVVTTSQDRRM